MAIGRYVRDVSVNLWANLLTASIIWLVAQATGVVRKNPAVTNLAVAILLTAAYLITGVFFVREGNIQRGCLRDILAVTAYMLVLIAIIATLFIVTSPRWFVPVFLIWIVVAVGVFVFSLVYPARTIDRRRTQ